MTTEALTAAGLAPTGIAGGRVSGWGGNAKLAGDDLFVVEADEYDKAFLTLHPTVAVVNNVEPDHLECYGSEAALEDAFVEFAGRAETVLVERGRSRRARVGSRVARGVRRFGFDESADLRITDVVQRADATEARVVIRGGRSIRAAAPGARHPQPPERQSPLWAPWTPWVASSSPRLAALAEFTGVGRRFERLGEHGGVAIVDDYAHHPSELEATLSAARQAFPGRRLVAVFQPHLYSRTAAAR